MTPQQVLPILIPLVVLGLVLVRASRPRKVRLELMWIMPVVLCALIVAGLIYTPHRAPFTPTDFALFALGFAAGAAVGWFRAKTTRLAVDPATHEVTSTTSPLGLIIIAAVFVVRFGLRSATGAEAASTGLDPTVIADAFLCLAGGLLIFGRVEIALRARALIAAARTGAVA